MNYPEMFAGAFPVSGGVIIQAEPTAYEKDDLRAAQRKLADRDRSLRENDDVASSQGKSTYESFLGDGFPMLRFFTHPTAAHMFAVLPVDAALQWLGVDDVGRPRGLVAFAEKQVAAKEWKGRDRRGGAAKAHDREEASSPPGRRRF